MTKSELSTALRNTSNAIRAESAERQEKTVVKEVAEQLNRVVDEYLETYQERTELSRTERERVAYENIMIQLESLKARIAKGL